MRGSKEKGKKVTNRSSEDDVGVLEGFISCGEVGEGDEAKTSRASGGAVYGYCGVGNDAVLGEVEFENVFGGVARNASYEQLRAIGIHLEIHCYCTQSLNPQFNHCFLSSVTTLLH